jgi:hypothetical protein
MTGMNDTNHSADVQRLWSEASVKALLAANLAPMIGVAVFDWDVRSVMMVYWAESGVIGLYTAVKMIMIAPWISIGMVPFFALHYGMFMAGHLFFLIVLTARDWDWETEGVEVELLEAMNPALIWAVAALLISHGVSFFSHFVRDREYDIDRVMKQLDRSGTLNRDGKLAMQIVTSGLGSGGESAALRFVAVMAQMFAPYKRIVLMHITLIAGAFVLIAVKGSHWPLLILLIAGKTMVDLRAHAKEHGMRTQLKHSTMNE